MNAEQLAFGNGSQHSSVKIQSIQNPIPSHPMTFIQACESASKAAQKTKSFRHVLVENSMFSDYEIASDFDLENWFLGSEPLASFGPDGMRLS